MSVYDMIQQLRYILLTKTQQNTSLAEYRAQIEKDLPFIYIFSLIVSATKFIVGIIWQNIDISAYSSGGLELPYFGCYISLASLAIGLVFIYNLISLKNDYTNRKYLRRFQLVLSVIVLIASIALTIILSIRANDYRQSQSQLTRLKYGTAIFSTVIAIIITIFALPVYLYLVVINYNTIKLTPDDKEQDEAESQTDVQQQHQRENPPEIHNNQNRVSDQNQLQLVSRKKEPSVLRNQDGFQSVSKQSERRQVHLTVQVENMEREIQSHRNIVPSLCIQSMKK